MRKTAGQVRKFLKECGGTANLGEGVTVAFTGEEKKEVDFNVEGDGLVGYISKFSEDEEPLDEPAFAWLQDEYKNREKVNRTILNFLEYYPVEENEPDPNESNTLTGMQMELDELKEEVAEADQRAEDAERAQERAEGVAEGLRQAMRMMLGKEAEEDGFPYLG